MTDFPVHHLCAALHRQVGSFESDAKYWLNELAKLKQFGFAAGTLPMLQLADDARNLRQLADVIEKQRETLTNPERKEYATQ
jgi:hypothetical protein